MSTPTPAALSVATEYRSRRADASGTLTVSVEDYFPESTSGFGEPGESAVVSLRFEPDGDTEPLTKYASVIALAPQLRKWGSGPEKTWVREAWAYEADADGDPVQSHRTRNLLFQFSTADDLRWDHLLDEVVDNAYLII